MKLTSTNFKDGDYLSMDNVLSTAYGFGCDGTNRSPQLAWSGAPPGATIPTDTSSRCLP